MTKIAWLAAILLTSWGCGEDSFIVRPEVPVGTPPAHLQERFDYYRSGYFFYEGNTCWFVPADREPPGLEYRCGSLSFGLGGGTTPDDIADLLAEISGVILRDSSDSQIPRIVLEVPVTTEGAALLQALLDARLRNANVSWSGSLVSQPS